MRPVSDDYLADPFVLRTAEGWFAYGTRPETGTADAFPVLSSPDLMTWTELGPSLTRLAESAGTDYWAPEVAFADGRYWMYYSVGHGDSGHSLRVAVSDRPEGPFGDLGVDLTPAESFAIDPHPFRDLDGAWYLFSAHDVREHERPGTHLAVDRLVSMTELAGAPAAVLAPDADWQLYERGRAMYGEVYDWHTLEGPSVVHRAGRYWLTYSGGSWQGLGYGVSWATAPAVLGPWTAAPADAPRLLASGAGLRGPGHNSLTVGPDGGDVIAFHAWDEGLTRRQMHLAKIVFEDPRPRIAGPVDAGTAVEEPR